MDRATTLPSTVERLIDELPSVGTLELLLLLRDASPERRALGDICSQLRSPETWAELQLHRLRDAGLIEGELDVGFAYAPRSAARGAVVDELARLWREDRPAVTSRMLVPARVRRRAGLHRR